MRCQIGLMSYSVLKPEYIHTHITALNRFKAFGVSFTDKPKNQKGLKLGKSVSYD
jgi:hypothetical protein